MSNDNAKTADVSNAAAARQRLRESTAPPILSDPKAPVPPLHLPIIRKGDGGAWAYTDPQHDDDDVLTGYRQELAKFLDAANAKTQLRMDNADLDAEIRKQRIREQAREQVKAERADAASVNVADSWGESDIGRYLDNPAQPTPTLLTRDDGMSLMYPGETTWIFGEPGCGKSWTAAYACMQSVKRGQHVVWLDFEGQGAAAVSRMMTLGCTPEELRQFFHLVEPETAYVKDMRPKLDALIAYRPAVVVFDAANDVLTLQGGRLNDVDTIAKFDTQLLLPFKRAGSAVAVVDHVTKNSESRGLWPINSGHKKACCSAAYSIVIRHQFRPDRDGSSRLVTAKDRHGNAPGAVGETAGYLVVRGGTFSIASGLDMGELSREAAQDGDHDAAIATAVENQPGQYSANGLAAQMQKDYGSSVKTWTRRINTLLRGASSASSSIEKRADGKLWPVMEVDA